MGWGRILGWESAFGGVGDGGGGSGVLCGRSVVGKEIGEERPRYAEGEDVAQLVDFVQPVHTLGLSVHDGASRIAISASDLRESIRWVVSIEEITPVVERIKTRAALSLAVLYP